MILEAEIRITEQSLILSHICPKCGGRIMFEYESGRFEPYCFNCGHRPTRNPDVKEKGWHTGIEPRHHHLIRTD